MPTPTNKKLYAKVKAEAKKKFDVWPSAYASAWLTKTYKARGGKYSPDHVDIIGNFGHGGGHAAQALIGPWQAGTHRHCAKPR